METDHNPEATLRAEYEELHQRMQNGGLPQDQVLRYVSLKSRFDQPEQPGPNIIPYSNKREPRRSLRAKQAEAGINPPQNGDASRIDLNNLQSRILRSAPIEIVNGKTITGEPEVDESSFGNLVRLSDKRKES